MMGYCNLLNMPPIQLRPTPEIEQFIEKFRQERRWSKNTACLFLIEQGIKLLQEEQKKPVPKKRDA